MRLFLSGRNSLQEEVKLNFTGVERMELGGESTDEDIAAYIEGFLEEKIEDGDLKVGDPALLSEVQNVLTEGAQGIPFEAQNLIDVITTHGRVVLHLYAPRLLLGFEPLDELRLYTTPALPDGWAIPPWLILQLNLFSGQLYFASFAEYTAVCDMLGLDWRGCAGKQEQKVSGVGADGFVNPLFRTTDVETGCTFQHSPVGFLKVYLSKVRRDSKGINRIYMGKMLDAVLLTEEEFAN
ncbi:hypothetical protein ACKVV7_011408 [Pyricularia oryzae]